MTDTAYERITDALRTYGCKVAERGHEKAEATCPAHEDRNASLSVTGIYGQTLIHCHAGCHYADVLAVLQLTPADLYDEKTATYRYGDGRTVKRFYDDRGKKRFAQTGAGTTSMLYRLDQLDRVVRGDGCVYLVEGEKDVHAIEAAGGVATTAPQGADSFHKVDVTPLTGHNVAVVVDRDDAGHKWATQVARKLAGVARAVRFFRARTGKDAADHIAAGHPLTDLERFEPFEFGDYFDGQAALVPRTDGTLVRLNPQYGDVAAMLSGGLPEPVRPQVLRRSDGVGLLYAGKVNVLFGDSESGKTWIALAAIVDVLARGGRAAFLDLDHNGMQEVVTRLLALGALPAVLSDLERFRYCEPQDAAELEFFVGDVAAWSPEVAVADSVGEILPMLGLSSNSPDDYTLGNRKILTPLAEAGAAVIAIDHLPKDDGAREKGQTGTLAKKRAINGVSLRVSVSSQFTPGFGGAANLTISKDRPGGLREHCPQGKGAPAGRFVMNAQPDGTLSWFVSQPPRPVPGQVVPDQDVAEVLGLPPDRRTRRKVMADLRWGTDRANRALQKCRELGEHVYDD